MTSAGGGRLSPGAKRLLVQIADPEAAPPAARDLDGLALPLLLAAIDHHGVEPVALRKLAPLRGRLRPELDGWIEAATLRQHLANALALTLDVERATVAPALADAGIAARIVKGPVFGAALYDRPSDRPFTDIDLLIARQDFARTAPVMQGLGFAAGLRSGQDRSDRYLEQKWQKGRGTIILFEIHADLVHYGLLRRRVSFGLADHEALSDAGAHPAVANLAIAAIHAAAGHKVHKLQLLVDVLQAARRLGAGDLAFAADRLARHPARLETLACLAWVGEIFGDRAARAAGLAIAGTSRASRMPILSADAILDSFGRASTSRVRRTAFRLWQHVAPRPATPRALED